MPIKINKKSSPELIAKQKLEKLKLEVNDKNLGRPFEALAEMTADYRNNIRLTLDFKWNKETVNSDDELRPYLESWEILDRNRKGIISRLHSISEQLNPSRYNGWRQTLTRILDLSGIHYKASASEQELEMLMFRIFEDSTKITKKKDSVLPTTGAVKLGKNVGVAAAILKDVGIMWDDILGCEDEPAMNAVYAICSFMHGE